MVGIIRNSLHDSNPILLHRKIIIFIFEVSFKLTKIRHLICFPLNICKYRFTDKSSSGYLITLVPSYFISYSAGMILCWIPDAYVNYRVAVQMICVSAEQLAYFCALVTSNQNQENKAITQSGCHMSFSLVAECSEMFTSL